MVGVANRVDTLIREVVEAEGLELVHVEYQGAGRSSVLRVYIDAPGGVTVDDCARVSRKVDVLLDVEDCIEGEYLLEVSSPGIERQLFSESDYRRFCGREVKLTALDKIEGRRSFRGVIRTYADGVLELECESRIFRIPFKRIKKTKLVYDFD